MILIKNKPPQQTLAFFTHKNFIMKHLNFKLFTAIILMLMMNGLAFGQISFKSLKNKAKEIGNKTSEITDKIPSSNSSTQSGSSSDSNAGSDVFSAKGNNYYVSPNGRGRVGSKEAPARDLAALISKLVAGDVVHIAAGVYTGKAGLSSDIITVPISIIGGYSPDFSSRDPWGVYKTIMSGTNELKAATTERIGIKAPRLSGEMVLDGLVIDNGDRNRFKTSNKLLILRKANMEKGENPTPETPGIKIILGADSKITIRNCVIMNTAPTQGALDVQIGKNSIAYIENNLIINNTGEGIMMKTKHHGSDGRPAFHVKNNTILFSWKHDAFASYGGNSIMMDSNTDVFASNNVFGFGDYGGVNNIKQCKNLLLTNNLFFGHKNYDYQEFTGGLKLDEMIDYAESINPSSSGNFSTAAKIPMNEKWAEIYFSRVEMSRAALDASVKVSNSSANQWRGMLGLPLQGSTSKMDAEVWLHKLEVDDAVKAGYSQYEGVGCQKP